MNNDTTIPSQLGPVDTMPSQLGPAERPQRRVRSDGGGGAARWVWLLVLLLGALAAVAYLPT